MNFLSDCLRMRKTPEGESLWGILMRNREEISRDDFESLVGLSIFGLLEEEETLDDFIADDPTSYFAKSLMENKTYYFIGTKGFEFFFIN